VDAERSTAAGAGLLHLIRDIEVTAAGEKAEPACAGVLECTTIVHNERVDLARHRYRFGLPYMLRCV
jgi:hypothetical protein